MFWDLSVEEWAVQAHTLLQPDYDAKCFVTRPRKQESEWTSASAMRPCGKAETYAC